MLEPKHDVAKMNFQVERFITFSDGVFAIVITIMVFDLKVPEIKSPFIPSDHLLWGKLTEMGLKFFGFLISFGIVGHYWSVHHRIYGYALKYTTALLWINLGFLLTVALLPFSSGLLGDYSSHFNMHLPYGVYVLNICLVALMNTWMWIYISNPKRNLLTRKISLARIKLGVYRSLVIPIIFLFSFLASLIFPILSRFMLLLIPGILLWGMGGLERKADRDEIIELKNKTETEKIREDENKELI
ncbi:MAG: TMEM175 family protein [Ginsengibacter sp.]